VLFTSGSTGRPKQVLLTYGNHLWSALGSAVSLGVYRADRWLDCLPPHHVGGLSILLRSVIYGTTAVLHDHFDPDDVNRAIDEEQITIVSVVANMLRRVLDARGEAPFPSSLRCVLLGGGPAPRGLLDRCAAQRVPVVQTYGLTEAASQVATGTPALTERKPGAAGRPPSFTEIATDAAGEILVRGPTVSPGYGGGAGPLCDADGWLHTGDLGFLDEEGLLYVTGRRDDMIVSGGENVQPLEVEIVLQSHPAVAEACAFGVADERWGQVLHARVCLTIPGAVTSDDLRLYARGRLAGFKVPRVIEIVDDLPRTASGKVLRPRPA
jgi:O-succinylbenzoic acid--CoA ligase